jgi:hypothetical protein
VRICVPVPEDAVAAAAPGDALPRTATGALGVIDNSKPRFDVLARAAVAELERRGFTAGDEHYVRKPSPTRPATAGEIERLANGTVAVLIGSGD